MAKREFEKMNPADGSIVRFGNDTRGTFSSPATIDDEGNLNVRGVVKIGVDPQTGAAGTALITAAGALTIQEFTVLTGSIPLASSEDINVAGFASDNILIVAVEIMRTAGLSTEVRAQTFSTDGFSALQATLFGDPFTSGVTPPAYGPQTTSSGVAVFAATPYHDLDGTQELHLRVNNTDGTNPGTFQLKFKYIDLGAFA
tara:strand:+ start:1648 stop:2247 length:600 start_codon:yes stop_codon:yes gene_type:complete